MNYSQAAVIETALMQADLAMQAAAEHLRIARDTARRAGMVTVDPQLGEFGIASALRLTHRKVEARVQFVREMRDMFEQYMADQGDGVALAAIAKRTAAKEEADLNTAKVVRRATRKRGAGKTT